jgi:formylglycine-generating enzyme required for sulfatase activity
LSVINVHRKAVMMAEEFLGGQRFVRLEPCSFRMGQVRAPGWRRQEERRDAMQRSEVQRWVFDSSHTSWDEVPVHRVRLTRPFELAVTPVTNAAYEEFDPDHARFRGRAGFSCEDDAAVLFVSWEDAVRYCAWLSEHTGARYRLPTEAEWECACRAGTTMPYSTGANLPREYWRAQRESWGVSAMRRELEPVSLRVGTTPANPWGLCDMHGLVEEWCSDWYGPYAAGDQVDPRGPDDGWCRVTRGGSHHTFLRYLRSANRQGSLPDDRSAFIGLRLARDPAPVAAAPLASPTVPVTWAGAYAPAWRHRTQVAAERCYVDGVAQRVHEWAPPAAAPLVLPPVSYISRPAHSYHGWHNHQPSITWCANGDLLAAWFSTDYEFSRGDFVINAARLRPGAERWDRAGAFSFIPDRNLTGLAIHHVGDGRVVALHGLTDGDGYRRLAMVASHSADNGASWDRPRIVAPDYGDRNQPIHGVIETSAGELLLPCDSIRVDPATSAETGNGTVLHASGDGGVTWRDLALAAGFEDSQPMPSFAAGATGPAIAGIHARVVECRDGSLYALGRLGTIDGRMPASRSADGGTTWRYAASPFPPVSYGQRLVLRRLVEGPLWFVGFTDLWYTMANPFAPDAVRTHVTVFSFAMVRDRLLDAGVPPELLAALDQNRPYVGQSEAQIMAQVADNIGAAAHRRFGAAIRDAAASFRPHGLVVTDAAGVERRIYGAFSALSDDDGATWRAYKPLTIPGPEQMVRCYGWVGQCRVDAEHAEIGGYLADTQTPDGVVHFISSGLHYRFNLAWLEQPMAARTGAA